MNRLPQSLALVALLVATGCNASTPNAGGAPTSCDGAANYPCGPYGTSVGAVLDNAQLVGRRDDNHDGMITDDLARAIQLADYHGDKSLKVLGLFVTTEWCGPCQQEQPTLVSLWKGWQASKAGVVLLEVLVQKMNHLPADQTTVDTWASHFAIPFDMAFDPGFALGAFTTDTFPAEVVITTADMRIRWETNGITQGAFETAINAALSQ